MRSCTSGEGLIGMRYETCGGWRLEAGGWSLESGMLEKSLMSVN